MPVHPFYFTVPSPYPFTASHFLSSSPILLNKSIPHSSRVLLSISSPLFSCFGHSYLPVYSSFLLHVSFSFSHSLSLSLHLLSLSMSLYDIVMNWQFLFFFLAANLINKMPSPQLSFPITAPLSVRMRVVPRLVKVFLCAGCWIEMDLQSVW